MNAKLSMAIAEIVKNSFGRVFSTDFVFFFGNLLNKSNLPTILNPF